MTRGCVTDEQYGQLDKRLGEVKRRVDEGTLSFDTAMNRVQCIIEGRGFEGDLIHGLFATPAQQLDMVKMLNAEHDWGFSGEDFVKLGQAPVPARPALLTVVILEVCLDTVQQTFDTAWTLAASKQLKAEYWHAFLTIPVHLRLLSGQCQRGLKWRIVDLNANRNCKPVNVCSPVQSPAAAILWMAYYSPRWVQSMNGKGVPFVFLPGYEACLFGSQDWQRVPALSFDVDLRQIRLSAHRCFDQSGIWAVPVFRE